MATGGKREEMDAKIKAWEQELERLRIALARAPDPVNARYSASFVELYRAKETVKSRWEAIRGVYRPEPQAVKQFEEALAAIEAAWAAAQPMFNDLVRPRAA
jgi:hypothetical protein